MNYLEKNMNPDKTMDKVKFKIIYMKIITGRNDDPTNLNRQISEVKEEYSVEMDKNDEIELVLWKVLENYEPVLVG